MAVDDNYREVIRKSGKEKVAGDNTDYVIQTEPVNNTLESTSNSSTDILTSGSTWTAL